MLNQISHSYSPDKQAAYDQKTFLGRMLHFLRYSNPMNALYTSSQIEEFKQLLKDYETDGPRPGVTDKQLWKAKYVLMSNIHPETGKEIPRLFRMSTFVLVNIPIAIGLAISPQTPLSIAFWQTANQSYNFGVNVVNANATNASKEYSELIKSYGIAVFSAASVSVSAFEIIKRSRWSNNRVFARIAPFLGVSVASCLNLFSSRYKDTKEGLFLRDAETDEPIPDLKSRIAGQSAFWQCALTRGVFIPFLVTMVPPLILTQLEKFGRMPKTAFGNHALNISIAGFILQCGLVSALAMFPQEATIKREKLEPYFQNLRNSKGNVIETFAFNKGL